MHEELPPDCNAGDTNQRESERRLIRMTVAACAPFHARSPVLGGQGRREQFDSSRADAQPSIQELAW